MINQQKVKSLFDYDKYTGILSWKLDNNQNGAKAGIEAGSIDLNGYKNFSVSVCSTICS